MNAQFRTRFLKRCVSEREINFLLIPAAVLPFRTNNLRQVYVTGARTGFKFVSKPNEYQPHLNAHPNVISTTRQSYSITHYSRTCNEERRSFYSSAQNFAPVVGHTPRVAYDANYNGQTQLFHPPYSIAQQGASYPHGAYLPYCSGMPAHQHRFVPSFANANNNNNVPGVPKPGKGSQHHIRQILG